MLLPGGDEMKIFGIDPGTRVLGWGFMGPEEGGATTRVVHGALKATASHFHGRVWELGQEVQGLLLKFQPDVVVLENIFLGRNPDSSFKLGHIRGVCSFFGQQAGAEIHELSPRAVKKRITGNGGADKISVRQSLYRQLGLMDDPELPDDASDALALVVAFRQGEAHWNSKKNRPPRPDR